MARITVVNDYPDFLDLMESLLEQELGHEVTAFDGQQTTVDEIADSRPDVLVLDLRLASVEGLSGADIVRRARLDDRLKGTPIIVASADLAALEQRTAEFDRLGAVIPLPKPFDVEQVLAILKQLLPHP